MSAGGAGRLKAIEDVQGAGVGDGALVVAPSEAALELKRSVNRHFHPFMCSHQRLKRATDIRTSSASTCGPSLRACVRACVHFRR